MFPIRDHNPSERTPYVTWALIAANVLIYFYEWSLGSNDTAISAFYSDWALFPAAVTQGGEYRGRRQGRQPSGSPAWPHVNE